MRIHVYVTDKEVAKKEKKNNENVNREFQPTSQQVSPHYHLLVASC
jgi:hypothetical protein